MTFCSIRAFVVCIHFKGLLPEGLFSLLAQFQAWLNLLRGNFLAWNGPACCCCHPREGEREAGLPVVVAVYLTSSEDDCCLPFICAVQTCAVQRRGWKQTRARGIFPPGLKLRESHIQAGIVPTFNTLQDQWQKNQTHTCAFLLIDASLESRLPDFRQWIKMAPCSNACILFLIKFDLVFARLPHSTNTASVAKASNFVWNISGTCELGSLL